MKRNFWMLREKEKELRKEIKKVSVLVTDMPRGKKEILYGKSLEECESIQRISVKMNHHFVYMWHYNSTFDGVSP